MSAGGGWCFTRPSAQLQNAAFSSHPSTYTKSGGGGGKKNNRWVLERNSDGKMTEQNPSGVLSLSFYGKGILGKAPSWAASTMDQEVHLGFSLKN